MKFLKPLEDILITSPFGNRIHPISNEVKFHNGVDLRAALNTPVRSIAEGTVVKVYNNIPGGNQLIIDHPEGYRSGFAHLAKSLVNEGDTVAAGQLIAKTGNTGTSTGPHLHYTFKKDGKYIDPEPYLKKKWLSLQNLSPSSKGVAIMIVALTALFLLSRK